MRPRCAALQALAAASLGTVYAAAECGELGRAHGLRLDFLNSEAGDDINNLGRGSPQCSPLPFCPPARAGSHKPRSDDPLAVPGGFPGGLAYGDCTVLHPLTAKR